MKNIFLMLCSLFLIINCKSDDESVSGNNNDGGNESNKMTYMGSDVLLNEVEFYNAEGEALYLYVHDGTGFYNGFYLIFPEIEFQDLDGTYTYNDDPFSETYDPNSNFWTGTITNHDTEIIGENISGGEITAAVNGNTITLNFELETEQGIAIGSYTGNYNERQ